MVSSLVMRGNREPAERWRHAVVMALWGARVAAESGWVDT